MWVAEIRLLNEYSAVGARCKRLKMPSLGAYIRPFAAGEKCFYPYFETFEGQEERIKMLVEDLESDDSMHNIERDGNSVFFIHEAPASLHNPRRLKSNKLFFTKQIRTDENGHEKWEVASWEEVDLKNFIVGLQKEHLEVKVISINNNPLSRAYEQRILPELTDAQKSAVLLAAKRGYYNFPRKTELEILAGEAKISLSTFREHLRKAEKKIFEDIFGKPEEQI